MLFGDNSNTAVLYGGGQRAFTYVSKVDKAMWLGWDEMNSQTQRRIARRPHLEGENIVS